MMHSYVYMMVYLINIYIICHSYHLFGDEIFLIHSCNHSPVSYAFILSIVTMFYSTPLRFLLFPLISLPQPSAITILCFASHILLYQILHTLKSCSRYFSVPHLLHATSCVSGSTVLSQRQGSFLLRLTSVPLSGQADRSPCL